MPDQKRRELAQYRLEKAEECYLAARQLYEGNLLRDSANRSYYAIFHAVRAILALDDVDFKKHSGVISYFQQHYIKTQIFDVRFSHYLRDAFSIRQNSDYEDFYIISRDETKTQLLHARELLDTVHLYVVAGEKES